jgi:hypothetical protein
MDDEAIIGELVAIRGIGRWTAEMFLIFHLLRPNVLPLDDVGLINGISRNYFSGEAGQPQRCARGGRCLGAVTAAWRLGIFGAPSTPSRSLLSPRTSDHPRGEQGTVVGQENISGF